MPGSKAQADIFSSPPAMLDDDRLADWVVERVERQSREGAVSLRSLLNEAPLLAKSPVALDAALDAILRNKLGSQEEIARALAEVYPDHAERVELALRLNRLVDESTATASLPLPYEIGPPLEDARPRYELRSQIGEGTHGRVYRAIDRHLSTPENPAEVAIKLPKNPISVLAAALSPLSEEALRARRVDHPGVVRVLDRGHSAGSAYVVYELVDGRDLFKWREKSASIAPRDAVRIAIDLCAAVEAIHAAAMLHADIKPANILISREGVLRLTDLGSARSLRSGIDRSVRGSLGFMAPEQGMSGSAPSTAADTYAIGGVLWWLLTGRAPNGETAEEAAEFIQTPPVFRSLRRPPRVDARLHAIVERSLQPQIPRRYASAASLQSDLRAWLEHRDIDWQSVPFPTRARLRLKRSPVTAAIIITALIAGPLIAAGWATSVEGHKRARVQAELAAAQAETDKARAQQAALDQQMTGIRAMLRTTIRAMNRQHSGELAEGWLPSLNIMAMVSQTVSGGEARIPVELATNRIESVKAFAAEAVARDGPNSFEALQYRTMEGFWRLQEGQVGRARELLEDSAARWGRLLEPGDSWRIGIEAIAAAGRCLEAFDSGADAAPADIELILRGERALSASSALRRKLLSTLVKVYSTGSTIDPLKEAQAKAALATWPNR